MCVCMYTRDAYLGYTYETLSHVDIYVCIIASERTRHSIFSARLIDKLLGLVCRYACKAMFLCLCRFAFFLLLFYAKCLFFFYFAGSVL